MSALLRAAGASRTAAKAMTQTRGYKVAVLGAAGGIGQPCGLLMKMVRTRTRPLSPFPLAGISGTDAPARRARRSRPPSRARGAKSPRVEPNALPHRFARRTPS